MMDQDGKNLRQDIDVSDDHLLLQQIVSDYGITAKQLSNATGRGLSTVYKYLAGEVAIPTIVWRCLYKSTKDARIVDLFVGAVSILIVPLEAPSGSNCVQQLIETRQAQHACENYCLKILADGKVDDSDKTVIDRYRREFPKAMTLAYQTYQMINSKFQNKSTINLQG